MTQESILTIIGILMVPLVGAVGWLLKSHIAVLQHTAKMDALVPMLCREAADILHSPHTPGIDALIEKYLKENGSMSKNEREKLFAMCATMKTDETAPKAQRMLAAIVLLDPQYKLLNPPKEKTT